MSYPCPVCGQHAAVIDSRFNKSGRRRRHHCSCGHRFSTIEVPGVRAAGGIAVNRPIYPQELVDKLRKAVNEVFNALVP